MMTQSKKFKTLKYLGVSLNKKGISSEDIVSKLCKGIQINNWLPGLTMMG